MKPDNFDPRDPDAMIDRGLDEIQGETLDPRRVEQAADRLWARISEHAEDVAREAAASSNVVSLDAHRIEGCAGFRALIEASLAGPLAPAQRMLLDDHLRECVRCRKNLGLSRDGHAEQPAERVVAHPARSRSGRSWLAAAAAVAVLAAGLAVWQKMLPNANAGPLRVESVQGALYRISDGSQKPLAQGATLEPGDLVRTAKDSRAVVRLQDGSLVEMAERSEIVMPAAQPSLTVKLPRGRVIVQAAKRSSGHLFVATDEATVAVTGTIFSVNHGERGSRVSVIEGQVHVDQSGKDTVLGPGQQVSTRAGLTAVPVADEISWSGNIDRYLALMQSIVAVRKDLDATLASKGVRHSTRLLDLMPADTVVYGALPNIGSTLLEANRRLKDEIDRNDVLRDWVKTNHAHGPSADDHLAKVLEEIAAFSDHLGDEIAFSMQTKQTGAPSGFLIAAEVRDSGSFRAMLEGEVGKIKKAAGDGIPMTLLSETLAEVQSEQTVDLSEAHTSGRHPKIFVWTGGDLFVASTSPQAIGEIAAQAKQAAPSSFGSSPFRAEIAKAYSDGAGWILCADLATLTSRANVVGPDGSTHMKAALERSGLLDARHFVLEAREDQGRTTTRASLSFDQPRKGLASWLAAPAPMGALGFISPDANLVAAFVVEEPARVFDELFAIIDANDPKAHEAREAFETKTGLSLRDDLAGPFGGEFALALDGPVIPVPGWRLAVEVYDPDRLQATLARLIEAANQHEQEEGGSDIITLTTETVNGRTYHAITSPSMPCQFHYSFVDGYLVAAPERSLLDRAIQNHETGYLLASSDRFRDLLPADGRTSFSALFYQNTGELLGTVAKALAGNKGLTPDQSRSVDALALETPAKLAVAYAEENRISFESSAKGGIISSFGGLFGLPGGDGAMAMAFEGALRGHHKGLHESHAQESDAD